MKQAVFVVEILSDGEKNSYAIRLSNGQLVACAFDEDGFYHKLAVLLAEIKMSSDVSSSVETPEME